MKLDPELESCFLKPAEICFVRKPSLIRTVLGSCITVTMFSHRLGAGAACHPVLPACRQPQPCRKAGCRDKYKYVECVIPEMIIRFKQLNVLPSELEIKLFGGANMFFNKTLGRKLFHIGTMNVSMARQKIAELQLSFSSFDTGGNQGRKLFFNTGNGDVWLKRFGEESAGTEERKIVEKQLDLQLNGYDR